MRKAEKMVECSVYGKVRLLVLHSAGGKDKSKERYLVD
jgi:hypothetical protein